ncbi:hypothetical protein C0Q70_08367 [Pomacea canaliculata]|uniref:BPTI/Kunitz inhibitor domain-containing protein n=1 Tax=Pomacea canaliculata TaxID=400727 RepID=A0A2T7PHQ2_POMCA|nr:kunitz-type serine protease inhibitor 2-like [Pomacea canaliculata]PVD32920.1 hypothetical protein C0Q70_08367 [Pomacea canaliculata]
MAPVLLVFALLFSAAVTSIQAEVPEYCNLDPEVGMCRGFFRMYFFNETSKHCEEFIYGGCGGNSNRFDDLSHCKITCIGA